MGKFNSGKTPSGNKYQESSIWKYLHNSVDFLLASELNSVKLKKVYVPNPEVESALSELLKYNTESRYMLLSGLTGSGKTTVMRHVFFNMSDSNIPFIYKRTLLIPFDFDTFIERNDRNIASIFEDFFVNELSHAIKIVKEEYNLSDISNKEFVDFLSKKSTGLINYFENGRMCSNQEIRKSLYKNDKLLATISELSILLNHKDCRINNVLFIVDNVESLGVYKNSIHIPLLIAHKSLTYMCNKSDVKRGKPKWMANILICCRHYVFRMMHTRDFENGSIAQMFESFCLPNKIELLPIELSSIIEKRLEVILKHPMEKVDSVEKWENAIHTVHNVINKILTSTRIEGRSLILDMNLFNIRSSMKTLRDIVYNKTWIQRCELEHEGKFIIENLSDFNIRLPYILRAIGMKSGDVYFSNDSLIPNLLKNDLSNYYNIYTLLSMNYFLNLTSSWTDSIRIQDYYERLNELFSEDDLKNNNLLKHFKEAIWHLLSDRILLRSSDQEQKDSSSITYSNYNQIECVYVSHFAHDYGYLISDNSVIFEMLLDDIFIDEKEIHLPSDYKTKFKTFNKGGFTLCLDYLNHLLDEEQTLIEKCANHTNLNLYIETFGSELICDKLLSGLRKSFDIYFRDNVPEEVLYKGKCLKTINSLTKKLNCIYTNISLNTSNQNN